MTELLSVIADALGVAATVLTRASSHETLAAWDSLGHVQVILAVEGHFGVRFRSDELPQLNSVEALARRLGRSTPKEGP